LWRREVLSLGEGSAVHDEDALVEAARENRRAFGELYDRYFDATYNYIYRRVGDHEAAEDLASATWERVLVAIGRYENRGLPFGAWLFRIAGNLVANHHREQRSRRAVAWDDAGQRAVVAGATEFQARSDERALVRGALNALAASDREVLQLAYYAGLSAEQMGAVLECSPAAAHKRLQRARTRFAVQLEALSRVHTGTEPDDE
jgi:RNA polymerase sigma-70 factor (ECF subfamily)